MDVVPIIDCSVEANKNWLTASFSERESAPLLVPASFFISTLPGAGTAEWKLELSSRAP